jgi:hypothetical protein
MCYSVGWLGVHQCIIFGSFEMIWKLVLTCYLRRNLWKIFVGKFDLALWVGGSLIPVLRMKLYVWIGVFISRFWIEKWCDLFSSLYSNCFVVLFTDCFLCIVGGIWVASLIWLVGFSYLRRVKIVVSVIGERFCCIGGRVVNVLISRSWSSGMNCFWLLVF